MIRHLLLAAAVWLLPVAACGPNTARVQTARNSAYSADFSIVWNAALAAVKEEGYDRLKVSDGAAGVIITDWHKAERVADSQATNPSLRGGLDTSGAIFFRVMVRVEGKSPPYRLVVDGEAARYRPGYSSLFPYRHGEEGEPPWVQGRIDAIYGRVYDQLEKYAVTGQPPASPATPVTPVEPEPEPTPEEQVPETTTPPPAETEQPPAVPPPTPPPGSP